MDNTYKTGVDMWNDTSSIHGIDEAITICKNYLHLNLKREHPDDERQFCRELFISMANATADKLDPTKLVYPYDFKTASNRTEISYFNTNRGMNEACTRGIDTLIKDSCYKSNFYNLEVAAMLAIMEYGHSRVSNALAVQIQAHKHDGRYSTANKKWAATFTPADKSFYYFYSHSILIDSFATYVRQLCEQINYTLPGKSESGTTTAGYDITRSIMVDDKQGYVIAHNPDAVNPWVCWQFCDSEDSRQYNWGIYGYEQDAINAYIARIFVALNKV